VEESKQDMIFLELDFEKAFDRVYFDYLWIVLSALGLGGRFLKLVRVLVQGETALVHLNGVSSFEP
jgi:hypothetical protein